MNKKSMIIAVAIASMMFLLGGCSMSGQSKSGERQQVEGLKELGTIQVISREEGSGTRSTFAQMADFQADSSSGKTDLTSEDALIANDAEEVIRNVENNRSAIGYVSEAALKGDEEVKVLNIEGRNSEENEKYPLSRDFYLTYSGKLNELEQDFLTYIHGAGQEIVGQDYVQVAKSSSFLSNKAAGEITIEGSTSVAPLMEQLAEAYEKINTNAKITVTATDSSKGLTKAMSGECDFGMSSRNLKDYEKELLDYETIARDHIVVIVEENNPLDDITLEELRLIYTGEMSNWNDLNQ